MDENPNIPDLPDCGLEYESNGRGSPEEDFWHWPHHFVITDDWYHQWYAEEALYRWCLENLTDIGGWHVRDWGIIILQDCDAMVFKLRFKKENE